jgi:hypothetical protein
VTTSDGVLSRAAVPSGASTGMLCYFSTEYLISLIHSLTVGFCINHRLLFIFGLLNDFRRLRGP